MESNVQSAYQEELQRLEKTAAEIERHLAYLRNIPRYYGNDFTEQILDDLREQKRNTLAIATHEPYFGRLDFQESNKGKTVPLYIGKVGVEDEKTSEPIVIDWRAPIASLFYSFTGGEDIASYESPDGLVEGFVYLKRNLVIRKQILQRVVDSYVRGQDNLGVSDEFLLYRLEENKDNRLRDIVSTIQEEQDSIIRSVKNKALIIQGVAGSGKTTVALHRLAYLLYRYRENIKAEKMIIFAPNSMFLDYISNVLPELGVGGIQQTTFSEWALNILHEPLSLADPAERLSRWFSLDAHAKERDAVLPGRVKGSVAFMAHIKHTLSLLEASFVPEGDFHPWEGATIKGTQIKSWFYQENKHYPLAKRKEKVVARIKRWIEMELDKVWETKERKELKKKSSQRLRAYIKTWPDYTPFTFYSLLFDSKKKPLFLTDETMYFDEEINDATLKLFKKKQVELEDFAPLIYIHHVFYGVDPQHMFDHIVIDEAQDFSPFQIALLKRLARSNSFTILGDLSQGIHYYQGITSWNEFSDQFDEDDKAYFELTRSYRSTMEIIDFANGVLSKAGENVTLAKPVFRSGDHVQVFSCNANDRMDKIFHEVINMQNKDWNTIAVIGRTAEECEEIHSELNTKGIQATIIEAGQQKYQGGLSVVPVYLAKGLEFDAVLIVDVDDRHYQKTPADAKLLYVGCTRALHHLSLLYSNNISPLIEDISIT